MMIILPVSGPETLKLDNNKPYGETSLPSYRLKTDIFQMKTF